MKWFTAQEAYQYFVDSLQKLPDFLWDLFIKAFENLEHLYQRRWYREEKILVGMKK